MIVSEHHAKAQILVYLPLNLLFWYLCDYIIARKRSLFLREGNQLLSLRQLEKAKTKFEELLKATMPRTLAMDVLKHEPAKSGSTHFSLHRGQ